LTQIELVRHWRYYVRGRMILLAVLLSLFFWLTDAVVDGWLEPGVSGLILVPDTPREWWIRLFAITFIFGFGIYAQASIRQHKAVAKKLREITVIDPLTGIFNRRRFDQVIHQEKAKHERYSRNMAVVMFDIDFFKRVNDNFGHAVGDRVLQQLVITTQKVLRESDYFFRWGGEEFLVLAPETNMQECLILAERLRTAVAEHKFDVVGKITISIGLGQYIKGENIDELLKRADDALYDAKHSGRNAVRAAESLRLAS